jgi:hypothetical protein
MTFLASVGSTAPFIGLFGTVWGIMNSFSAIAASNNTSLAVVAPGIAEASVRDRLGSRGRHSCGCVLQRLFNGHQPVRGAVWKRLPTNSRPSSRAIWIQQGNGEAHRVRQAKVGMNNGRITAFK